MLKIGQLEYVFIWHYVYGTFYRVDSEKALINKDTCQERKLHVELCILVV